MDPEEQSKITKHEADSILETTNILNLLSNFGDVRVGGGYGLDLMYGPDIDITVETASPRESAVNFLNQIIEKRIFQKVQYGDFEKFPRNIRTQDHIVVLIYPFNNRRWEIEIWFTRKHYADQIELEEKVSKLPTNIKQKIVELKAERAKKGLDKHSLSSYQIYQSFL